MSELRMENRRYPSASKALTWLYGGLCIARCNQTLQSPLAENSRKSLEEGVDSERVELVSQMEMRR